MRTVNSLLTDELSLSEQKAELWKEIPGYEGLYEASTLGRIRSVDGKVTSSARFNRRIWKQRLMKQKTNSSKKGRKDCRVCLWKDGKEKTFLVARLIALTWCDGYAPGLTVNHINGNNLDNRAENLEWCALQENITKGFNDGLYDSISIKVSLQNTSNGELVDFRSRSSASRFLGRNHAYISNMIHRKYYIVQSKDGDEYKIVC